MRNSNWNYGRTIVVVPDVDCVIYCLSRVTVFFTRRNRVLSRVTAPSFLFDYGGVRRPTEDGRRTHPSYFGTLSISDCVFNLVGARRISSIHIESLSPKRTTPPKRTTTRKMN